MDAANKTPPAQLRASQRYYQTKREDAAWVAARREKERARRAADPAAHNARARAWYAQKCAVTAVVAEYERLAAEDPELAAEFARAFAD